MTSWSSVDALGRSRGLCWRSWPTLGTSLGDLGLLLRPAWAVLAALGAFVGGLVLLLGPMLAVLGRSWVPCWRSWAALGRKVALARAGRRSGRGQARQPRRHLMAPDGNFLPIFSYRYLGRGPKFNNSNKNKLIPAAEETVPPRPQMFG